MLNLLPVLAGAAAGAGSSAAGSLFASFWKRFLLPLALDGFETGSEGAGADSSPSLCTWALGEECLSGKERD